MQQQGPNIENDSNRDVNKLARSPIPDEPGVFLVIVQILCDFPGHGMQIWSPFQIAFLHQQSRCKILLVKLNEFDSVHHHAGQSTRSLLISMSEWLDRVNIAIIQWLYFIVFCVGKL